MCLHIRNALLFILLVSLVAACGGGGGGSGSGANMGGGSNAGSAQSSLSCDSNASNPYVGCFVSNNCVSSAGTTNYSNLTLQFMNDGTLRQTVRIYSATDCSGSELSSYTLPAAQTFVVRQDQLSSTGQTGQIIQVDTSIAGVSQLATGYTLANLNKDQLCFAQNDYTWTSSGGGFQPLATTAAAVNKVLNVTACLTRM